MLSTQTAHRRIWQPLWQLPSRAELIFSFAKRELLGRYKGSALGIAWAVLTPVVMIAIFTFIFAGIFGARFGVNQSHWDYALYLFCGLLPWSMFQESVQQSSNTIVATFDVPVRPDMLRAEGDRLLVADPLGAGLAVIDTNDGTGVYHESGRIDDIAGVGLYGGAAYRQDRATGTVTRIDLTTGEELTSVALGPPQERPGTPTLPTGMTVSERMPYPWPRLLCASARRRYRDSESGR